MSTVSSPARVEVPKGIAKWLLLSIAFVLSVLTSRATEAVIPQLNHSYYIAAQTWDGKQYVERVLTNVSAGNVLQSLEITDAARWMVTGADADGAVTLLSPVGKRLMTGGISSSTNVRNLVSVPAQWTLEDHPEGAVFEEKVDPTNGKTYNCRKYADYSTYFMYSTPEMIAEYKAKIKACGPKNTSIIFIDDRFASPMHNEWADEGRMRGPRDNSAGSQGNMGNVADFTPEAIANGTAPVGYKVYDEEGNLLYYTATVNADGQPVIPANVMARIAELADGEDKLVVAEVSSNHDVVEVADENDHIYTLTHYAYDKHGNRREPHTVTSPGRLKPVLGPNEMVVVGKRTESVEPRIMYSRNAKAAAQRLADEIPDYKFADQHNVIIDNDGYLTMASLDITDGKPIYLPANDLGPVTADHVTYTRNNIQEWNSVCLPFALSADDLPQGSKIYIVGGYDSSTITLFKVSNVEAGRPCFVYCPAGTDKWNIDIDLCDAVTTDVAVSNPMGLHLEGTFEKTVAPQGSYAIDADGDGFNKNETDTEVAPMRSYVAAGNARTNASNLALVVVDDTSGAQPVVVDEVPMQHDVMYDLLGRPLKMPKRGQPYILNGRVVVDR